MKENAMKSVMVRLARYNENSDARADELMRAVISVMTSSPTSRAIAFPLRNAVDADLLERTKASR